MGDRSAGYPRQVFFEVPQATSVMQDDIRVKNEQLGAYIRRQLKH